MRLIDGDALYKKICDLEAQALSFVSEIKDDDKVKIWYAILTERTAFKHDVFDAPTIESENKTGRWIEINGKLWRGFECDQCGHKSDYKERYCAHCGAKMER